MISKERLQELIEQGATIYADVYGGIEIYDLLDEDITLSPNIQYALRIYGSLGSDWFDIKSDYLFETLEEAEWHKEFGCIERTERLELPTWQQIENIIEQKKKFGLNHSDRVLARIITNDSIYYFKLCKDLDLFTFELKQTYIGEDLCEQITSRFPVSLGKATKANYEKACRKCKEIFLGE